MRLHILGIGGTFMGGLALLAKQRGDEVRGSDRAVYPPMSTQLQQQGITLFEGYDAAHLDPQVDCVLVGNVIKRGNPAMEYILANKIPYMSGPAWLAANVLQTRSVLGVAGTHGKTTTTSMLAWILEQAGLRPGFLIGGIPENFGVSARLGEAPFFVIEADEYDSAFFDKRAKFIHYAPKTLILNNLEFDHADIFADLDAVKQQFHFLVRTIPGNGLIVRHAQDANLTAVLEKGCWTPVMDFGVGTGALQAVLREADGSAFQVLLEESDVGEVQWDLLGRHNVENALAAIAAAHHVGVVPSQAIRALSTFKNVKRRLEVKGKVNDILIYDDFAHHPTAIATTLAGLRAKIGKARLIAVLEFGSYTMRSGVHQGDMQRALQAADRVVCQSPPDADWDLAQMLGEFKQPTALYPDVDSLVSGLVPCLEAGDHVVVMSNSGFGGIHQKLLDAIDASV
ncbi:MAG: UDP-N-acetylmuramate:L-alanyl-gamma-D-glutamyl-meso-diaminopimelate ligase [Gammaproteobacteria bacterium RIFCSPHIGHO2_12_FULL_45_12]|nr:MAG: UDP-N-acetylmuramate:L-alanyl-gamma-D-glutamyl-meso-diaminopimelate ligase [Gammaproteobacteria bacterium RIFCSPHIGHO2_12_FULL_45_12]